MATYEQSVPSSIRGYHVYKEIWKPAIVQKLQCVREPTNATDKYAVSVVKNEIVVGHLPRKISRSCSLFLHFGGGIMCVITGRH